MTWIGHPALRELGRLPAHESLRIANERMAALGDFMGQFHVLTINGRRYLVEAYRHHFDPIGNPLGIVARLPALPPPPARLTPRARRAARA
jgi:hypothetical protein